MARVCREGLSSVAFWTRSVRANRGATLVEVVAAVTLLGLIGVGIYALTMMPVRALEQAHTTVLYERTVRSMVMRLSNDLANVSPDGYLTRPHFIGGPDRMEFTVGTWHELDALRVVAYVFQPWWTADPSGSSQQGRLVRTETSPHTEESGYEGNFRNGVEVVRAGDLRFEYYDAQEHLWLSSWDASMRGWPSAVRVVFIPKGEDRDDAVEILFPVFTGRLFRGAVLS